MRSIKNNTSISDFDYFLCKLEEKEEFSCFIIRCWAVLNERCKAVFCNSNCTVTCSDHYTVDGQSDKHKLDTNDGQNDKHELPNDGQNDEHESDEIDHESAKQHKSFCLINRPPA